MFNNRHPITTSFLNEYDTQNSETGLFYKHFNSLSKPTGHVMHHQFNIQQLYALPHCIYVFCIYLRTNSDLCHLQHKLIGFYNPDEMCLQRGTDWVFT